MTICRLICVFAIGLALPLPAAQVPPTIEQWGMFQLELRGPTNGNPFLEVHLGAAFTNGTRKIEAEGFYDGSGIYRLRFMPETTGLWHYETRSNRPELTGLRGSFNVVAPGLGNHGPVRVHNIHHFAYADGTPFKPVGTTIYNWLDTPEELQAQTLQTLSNAPFNKARILITQQPTSYRKQFTPPRWPFAGEPPHNWDLTRFNPDFFNHYEQRLAQLRDLGIEADLILFNPYGKWGFEAMDADGDDRYVRYVVARLAAFRNVWWSLANEYDFIRTKTEPDWDRLGALVQQCDPYNHLRSIHNGSLLYNHTRPWVTHASIQNGAAVEEIGRAQIYRDVYRKPVIFDEVGYEGDGRYRWAGLSGPEMVHRFWCGTVGGTYVGHGDYFFTVIEDTWTSFGGKLAGQSAPRLAFLRKILEAGPADGLDPIDKSNIAGIPGEYYLAYFGQAAPTNWIFRLYKQGLTEGLRFKADVIDTWAMTIKPVPGEFVTRKLDNYYFADAQGRSIDLPGSPGIALRIQRIGASPAKADAGADGPAEPH
jgi:hypothetical protein